LPTAVLATAGRAVVNARRAYGSGGKEDPSLCDRIFLLASITKTITAVGMARLVDQGHLRYDDPVVKFIPEFGRDAGRRKITIAHVLTHSSGLPSPSFEAMCSAGPEENYKLAFEGPLAYEPGTRTQYMTLSFQLLNEIVWRLLRTRMPEFLREWVLEPCGMRDTGFTMSGNPRAMPPENHPLPGPDGVERFQRAQISGGGLSSTADDLIRFGLAVLDPGRLMRRETFARMVAPAPNVDATTGAPTRRTLGWNRNPQPASPHAPVEGFYHGGATGTLLWLDPQQHFVFVFLSNRWVSCDDYAFAVLEQFYR
jgi:CubicO group peptidase (beta-lactamase class C family)